MSLQAQSSGQAGERVARLNPATLQKWTALAEANEVALVQGAIELASRREPPDGYICGGEIGALAVLRALERSGRVIGRDAHLATMETSTLPSLFHAPVSGFSRISTGPVPCLPTSSCAASAARR